MFVRVKTVGPYQYLQVVANHREGRRTVQRVVGTLGRLDQLQATGATDALGGSTVRVPRRTRRVSQCAPPALCVGVGSCGGALAARSAHPGCRAAAAASPVSRDALAGRTAGPDRRSAV